MLRTALVLALFALPAAAEVRVENARIYETTPVARAAGGYFTAVNEGADPVRLSGIESDLPRAEFHETLPGDDGVTRMAPRIEGFEIPAGEDLVLERGGKHVMFMGLTGQLSAGDVVEATLVFADGTRTPVSFEVVRPGEEANGESEMGGHEGMDHGGMDHGGMDHGAPAEE